MPMFRCGTALAVIIATIEAASAGTAMQLQGPAFPPPAFNRFCQTEPGLCSTSGGAKVVRLTEDRMKELESVNKAVNRRVHEQSDQASFGKDDDWRVPAKVGDCEDFAIL